MKAILIDSPNQELREIDIRSAEDIVAVIGGAIRISYVLENGDTVFSAQRPHPYGFILTVEGKLTMFSGKGLIFGFSSTTGRITAPQTKIGDLWRMIVMDREY